MTLPTPDTNSDASGEIPLPPGFFAEKEVNQSPELPREGGNEERNSQSVRTRMRSSSKRTRSNRSRSPQNERESSSVEHGSASQVRDRNRMRRRVKDDGEFDPTRHTGERNVSSLLGDIGYFAQQQFSELKNVLRRARRLSKDMVDEVLSKLRK
ncbi:MAG: hypothetical protein ACE361_23565 [Aureliella sp.]